MTRNHATTPTPAFTTTTGAYSIPGRHVRVHPAVTSARVPAHSPGCRS